MTVYKLQLDCHLDVLVDLGVEIDEHHEGDDSVDDEPAPVEVHRVHRRGPHLRRLQVERGHRLVGHRVLGGRVLHLGLKEPGIQIEGTLKGVPSTQGRRSWVQIPPGAWLFSYSSSIFSYFPLPGVSLIRSLKEVLLYKMT